MFSLDFGGEVLLVYVVVWVVVGVFVADAVAQFFVAAVVGVLECGGTVVFVRLTESMAAKMALTAELLLGAQAM